MKSIVKLYLISTILLGIYSCHQEKKEVVALDGTNVNIPDETINNYSFLKSVDYVFLDGKVPIGKVDQLLMTDKNIIICDKRSYSVNIYNKDGELLNRINRKGNGAGEYSGIDGIAISYEKNLILVLNSNLRKILMYSIKDGSFVKEIHTVIFPSDIACDDSYIYLYNYSGKGYSSLQEQLKYYIFVLNYSGNVNARYIGNDDQMGKLQLRNRSFFSTGNTIFYNNKYDTNIYSVYQGNVVNCFNVVFKGNEKFSSFLKTNIENEIFEILPKSGFAYDIQDLCIGKEYMVFNYIKNNQKISTIVKSESNKVIFNSPSINCLSNELFDLKIPYFVFPTYCYKDEFIGIIEPWILKDTYDKNKSLISQDSIFNNTIQRLKKVDVLDNPILAFYKFK